MLGSRRPRGNRRQSITGRQFETEQWFEVYRTWWHLIRLLVVAFEVITDTSCHGAFQKGRGEVQITILSSGPGDRRSSARVWGGTLRSGVPGWSRVSSKPEIASSWTRCPSALVDRASTDIVSEPPVFNSSFKVTAVASPCHQPARSVDSGLQ